MNTRRLPAALTAGLAICCPPVSAGARALEASRPATAIALRAAPFPLNGPASEQTAPAVNPRRGRRSTRFVLELTARQRIGVSGGLRSDYRVALSRTGGSCADDFTITSATAGARLRKTLRAPSSTGWCRGHYTGLITLDRAPSCSPLPDGRPVACPQFALAPVGVGHFSFTAA